MEAVHVLPDDATVEDAIERLCFLAEIQKGAALFHRPRSLDLTVV